MIYSHENSEIIFSTNISDDVQRIKSECNDKIFILTDCNTRVKCLPLLEDVLSSEKHIFSIPDGESNKNIDNILKIWDFLQKNGADRKSILLNVGGGVLCDMGGFAASTFKRGIRFINIPTTLLSQVDASVGGKTGINFNKLKNEIGAFAFPCKVIIHTAFLKTLSHEHILSGFGEMIKHALINNEDYYSDLQKINLHKDYAGDFMLTLIKQSVDIKKHIVEADPTEQSIRKALNFGHTIGHALESYFMGTAKELLHGQAVAYGIIIELYLSHIKLKFPVEKLIQIENFINKLYGKLILKESDYRSIYTLMKHDKKNDSGKINCTLLKDIGKVCINQAVSKDDVYYALRSDLNFFSN